MTHSPGRLAYLVSQYPAYSHAFIESEVDSLRQMGWEVHTFSVNESGIPDHPETGSTFSLKGFGRVRVGLTAVLLCIGHPIAAAHVLADAWASARRRPRMLRSAVWQIFYVAQAAVFYRELTTRRLGHVHVHFANNAADVAAHAVRFGQLIRGATGPRTWSLTVHGPSDLAEAAERDLAWKVSAASLAVCISDFGRTRLAELIKPSDVSKLRVVRMGVGPAVLAAAPGSRSRYSGTRPFRILFVGRLVSKKGPDVLIEALALLDTQSAPAEDRLIEALIVGEGPMRSQLEAAANSLPASVHISFLGATAHADVIRLYDWADVFCLPSYSEGLPVVLMEALGSGVPSISTPVAGIPELVVDGVTGVLVQPGVPGQLAHAIRELRGDPDLCGRIGEAGREIVRELYDARKNAMELALLFGPFA